jgi:ABC-2 type transport system permease protein
MNIVILGRRVLTQLVRDWWFLIFSLIAPALVIFLLRIFFDTFPEQAQVDELVIRIAGILVFLITFVLSMISVVEERVNGTLQRMFVNGISRTSIILGYILGYLVIATVQTIIVIGLTLALFELDLSNESFGVLFATFWMLSVVSVALGILVSSFVRRQVQIIPFIPLVLMPSVFLSGTIVETSELPEQAQIVGRATPIYYVNDILEIISEEGWEVVDILPDLGYLLLILVIIVLLASFTLKPSE